MIDFQRLDTAKGEKFRVEVVPTGDQNWENQAVASKDGDIFAGGGAKQRTALT